MSTHAYIPDPQMVQALHPTHLSQDIVVILLIIFIFFLMMYPLKKMVYYFHREYMGIEVVFIAPAKPWMNGTIERFNKDFGRLFWNREKFASLKDIQKKFKTFTESHNKFVIWKEKSGNLHSITPKRKLARKLQVRC